MSFSLRFAKSPLDRRPGGGVDATPEPSNVPAFARGLLIGFSGDFFIFDWALMGGAVTRGYFFAVQQLLASR